MTSGHRKVIFCTCTTFSMLFVSAACSRQPEPPRQSVDWWSRYYAALHAANSEAQAKQAVQQAYREQSGPNLDLTDAYLRQDLLACDLISESLLEKYPAARFHCRLVPSDLLRLAEKLKDDFKAHGGVSCVDEDGEIREGFVSMDHTVGQIAADWLLILTGRRFDTNEEFRTWFEQRHINLYWDRQAGMFVEIPQARRRESTGQLGD